MNVFKNLRVSEWWGYKVPMLWAIFIFFCDTSSSPITSVIQSSGILLWWIVSAAAFGYLVNNIFDLSQDNLAGKANFTSQMSVLSKWLSTSFLAISALMTWIFFYPSLILFLFSLLHLCLFLLYSVPPIRLKEKGYLGVLTDATYAYCIPVIISLCWASESIHKAVSFSNYLVLVAIFWAMAAGSRSILLHQFKDRKADKKSKTFNVVNRFGLKTNSLIVNTIILPLELLSFFFILIQHPLYPLSQVLIFCSYLVLITFTMTRFGVVWNFRRRFLSMRFSPTQFYEGWFLLINLFIASISHSAFLFLIPLQIVLFQNEVFQFVSKILIIIYAWIKAFYYALKRLFKPVIVNSWHHLLRPALSLLVNYGIYYFRRLILRQSPIQATSPLKGWLKSQNYQTGSGQEKIVVKRKIARKASEVWEANALLSEDNRIVNGLWIGQTLSYIELLTVKSFMEAGHTFRLWVYEKVDNVPLGVEVCDANTIITSDRIFRYKTANAFGHGKGSVSGFSDVFRYKLLYDQGGWWVDMDICCIRPFGFCTAYFFRVHHDLDLVGNIMKCPKGSPLMWDCYVEASQTIDENNTDWHKPIEILNRHVASQGLTDYIFGNFSNEDKWGEIKQYIFKDKEVAPDYVALHWMNEEWRSRGINKNDIRYNSRLGRLLAKYYIIQKPSSNLKVTGNDLRHLIWIPLYDKLKTRL